MTHSCERTAEGLEAGGLERRVQKRW